MPLLPMEYTAATNFLACQAGCNLFTVPRTEQSPKSPLCKPLPMLPVHPPSPRRTPIAPCPSPSMIMMQQRGLEITAKEIRSQQQLAGDLHTPPLSPTDNAITSSADTYTPNSPHGSQLTRASSMYSTESAHSTDSLGDSISQIVEMYTDLVTKIPLDDIADDVQILQPKAYRDTIAPLLEMQFSREASPTDRGSVQPLAALRIGKKQSKSSLTSSNKQIPGFQEFSRNLRDRRAELVSPMSAAGSNYTDNATLDSISEPSPTSLHMRPFSFASESVDHPRENDEHGSIPFFHYQEIPGTQSHQYRPLTQETLDHVNSKHGHPPSPPSYQQIRYDDLLSKQLPPVPAQSRGLYSNSSHPVDSARLYQQHSLNYDPKESVVIYNGMNETVKPMVKSRIKKEKDTRERDDTFAMAKTRYPGTNNPLLPSPEFSSGLENRVNEATRGQSMTIFDVKNMGSCSPPQPQRVGKSPAVPQTSLQERGRDIPTVDGKGTQSARDNRHRLSKLKPTNDSKSKFRPRSSDTYQPNHRRTSSSKPSENVTSPNLQGKKNSFIAVLEGAKNSLTNSSADRRREKLKDSIVIVGPTHLSVDHGLPTGRSLP